jgi:uncharacterized protein
MKQSRYNVWVDEGESRFVYNGLSGAIAGFPITEWPSVDAFLSGADDVHVDAGLLRDLVAGRMIITDDTDELALLRERYRITRRNAESFHLTIVTSLGCNFDCPYCFEAKHPSLLDRDVQDRLLQLLDTKLPSLRELTVTWYGGEPLVGKDALLRLSDEFLARTRAAGIDYAAAILTNGYLLTADVAGELRDRRINDVQVTLDGPPEIHDPRRPLAGGRGSFRTILDNLVAVADILPISVRVNLDAGNAAAGEPLLQLLAAAGLAGRLTVYPAHVVAPATDPRAPSAGYHGTCLSMAAFADIEREFYAVAARLGFRTPGLPRPVGAPCTAVRDNELVVGSRGELYKCTETVGNPGEVIGNLLSWPRAGDRLLRWLTYEPFDDAECRSCPALPVCMGGCAYHAMQADLRDSRCSTFRFTHEAQVREFIRRSRVGSTPG